MVKVFGFEYPSMMYYEEKRRHMHGGRKTVKFKIS